MGAEASWVGPSVLPFAGRPWRRWEDHHVPGRSPGGRMSSPMTMPPRIASIPRIRHGRPGRQRSSPRCSWGPRSSSSTSSISISPGISPISTAGLSASVTRRPIRSRLRGPWPPRRWWPDPVHLGHPAGLGLRHHPGGGVPAGPVPAAHGPRPRLRGRRDRDVAGGLPVEGELSSRISSIPASTTAWPASSSWSSRCSSTWSCRTVERPGAA